MKQTNTAVKRFWQAYCQSIGRQLPQPEAWSFGMTTSMANELADLVVKGKKTATTSAFIEGEAVTQVGDYDIILNGDNQPVAIIQNVVSEIMPYQQVSAEHAYHEGEGDRTLAYWRRVHEAFFREEGAQDHYQFSNRLLMSCEVFELRATQASLADNLEANE
ncbi:MAG: ASCH domain-containing protein [Furfurilactobacillus sp.]|uniref:ASCH domain-containing protein n=1 Tax=Furfurilactobacillus milii TaxID=2888272 RepID=A0ABT6D9C7_9LACO|nr:MULTISPECIES: ASCH domain-containing protein [Furfurilactobacillus]QLE65886.1 hypothetical protein LROSL2_0533 [Furfurilactobacillus rossiae]MCF6160206.1 ASCH domain-containing protein [Furfurilactobacillus milii]MCF6162149.1 ASCH domain-containing protein [Furfurilactobacillus milii]MCF6420381.1 ASCH domain-containing protein [Furfurilactobacillus milii]MCH4012408.1 ASCH domain-containing protein [Furfurilactobacillus sp.]